jgi:hypothetical protein
MADETRQGDRGRGTGGAPAAGRTVSGPIGEAEADDFAADVAVAGGEETGVHDSGGAIAGAAGGGTGIGDMAGGTGIGTDDGGNDAGETGGGGIGKAGGDEH